MKKIVFIISILLTILYITADALDQENSITGTIKDKYGSLYTITNEESPLVVPYGIAVDSNDNIYIANKTFNKVQVYNNNKFICSYSLNAENGTIYLKIDKNNILYISLVSGKTGFKFMNHQLIDAIDDYNNDTNYPNDSSNYCTDINGNTYIMNNIFGYDYITKTTPGGTKCVVYSMPIMHYLIKLFVVLFFIFLFILVARKIITEKSFLQRKNYLNK